MTRASEIVQALIERSPPRPPLERTTGLPYGWALWLRALPPLPPRPHAPAREMVGLFVQRPPQAAVPGRELATWPAFFSLFQQGWQPPPRDERPLRWTSRVGSGVLHVLFVVFLAWMAYLQSLLPPVPPEAGGGGERVEVGFIGAGDPGTPQVDAGEAPAGPSPGEAAPAAEAQPAQPQAPAQAEAAAPQVPSPQSESAPPTPVVQAPPDAVPSDVPEPQAAPPSVEQPVQVTEVEQPTTDYVLPPVTPREVEVRPLDQPQLREREVALVQAPDIPVPQARPVDVPAPPSREVQLRVRDIEAPSPRPEIRPLDVPAPRIEARLPDAPEASVRERELALPAPPVAAPAPATAAAPAPAAVPATVPAPVPATGTAAAAAPVPGPGQDATRPAADRAPGATLPGGAAATPAASSGWQSPRAGDDWGQARSGEVRPGSAPGLFDSEGRVRLPGDGQGPGPGSSAGEGVADRGAPGGDNDAWTRDRIDQSGTWLKRPPYDYEPTSFDRYWVPNESLLAEWVRKGIKSVAIPIPGTGKKINCVVSLLQLGGGCGITDPDLNEQPAAARPPPDIPFKPELQKDNGSTPR